MKILESTVDGDTVAKISVDQIEPVVRFEGRYDSRPVTMLSSATASCQNEAGARKCDPRNPALS